MSGDCLYVFDLVGRADWQFLIKIGGIGRVQCAVDIDICRAIPVNVVGRLSVQKTVQVKHVGSGAIYFIVIWCTSNTHNFNCLKPSIIDLAGTFTI